MRVLALALVSACTTSPDGRGNARPGQHPDDIPEAPLDGFALRNQDGVVVASSDLLGHPVIMDIGVLW